MIRLTHRHMARKFSRQTAAVAIAGALTLASLPASPAEAHDSRAFWAVFGAFTALSVATIASRPRYVYYGPAYAAPVYAYPAPAPYYYPPAYAYPPAPAPMSAPLVANPTSPAFQSADGRLCRSYQATPMTAAGPQLIQGTACQGQDGVWRAN